MSDEVVLAERRRRKKWSLNPRGKLWSDDNEKLGQKMLEKMGWSKGKGLGAKGQGMANPILVHGNHENKGLGFEGNPDQWVNHQDDFNDILASLNASSSSNEQSKTKKSTSLEERSKSSKRRVHYHKFTRGKDLSRWKDSDLACIFGKKSSEKRSASRKADEIQEAEGTSEEKSKEEEIGSVSNQHGVTVIKGGSMTDYFAKKWNYFGTGSCSNLPSKEEEPSDVDERPSFSCGFTERAGFGANTWVSGGFQEEDEPKVDANETTKPKKHKGQKYLSGGDTACEAQDEECGDVSGYMDSFVKGCVEVEGDLKRKMKKKEAKHKALEEAEEVNENLQDNIAEVEKKKKPKKKKREREEACDEGVGNVPSLASDTEAASEVNKKKKRKKETEENSNDYEPKKKKKKKRAMEENDEEVSHRKKKRRSSSDEHLQLCSKETISLASVHRPRHVKAF